MAWLTGHAPPKAAINAPAQWHEYRRAGCTLPTRSSNFDHVRVTTSNAGSGIAVTKRRKRNRGELRFCTCSVVPASAPASAVALEIAVVIAVPMMIVDDHAAWALPVSRVKRLAFVAGA